MEFFGFWPFMLLRDKAAQGATTPQSGHVVLDGHGFLVPKRLRGMMFRTCAAGCIQMLLL